MTDKDNPYFPVATAGSIAARFYELGRLCEPEIVTADASRKGSVLVLIRMLQKEGKRGARQLALATAGMAEEKGEAVQKQADALIRDLAAYNGPEEKSLGKGRRKSSPER